MRVRTLILATAAALAVATAARAGDPVPGADVSVEESGTKFRVAGGSTNGAGSVVWRAPHAGTYVVSISGAPAIAACNRAIADSPPRSEREGRGIAIGRAGGSFSPTNGAADGPGVVVSLTNSAGKLVAAQWASCDALTTGRPNAAATLTPITLDRAQATGALTIGVGYVAGPKPRG